MSLKRFVGRSLVEVCNSPPHSSLLYFKGRDAQNLSSEIVFFCQGVASVDEWLFSYVLSQWCTVVSALIPTTVSDDDSGYRHRCGEVWLMLMVRQWSGCLSAVDLYHYFVIITTTSAETINCCRWWIQQHRPFLKLVLDFTCTFCTTLDLLLLCWVLSLVCYLTVR